MKCKALLVSTPVHHGSCAVISTNDIASIRALLAQIPDPEIPAVTLVDLGILRNVSLDDDVVVVDLTPTYSGCPATEMINTMVRETLAASGFNKVRVHLKLDPPWSSDWITPSGRTKLKEYGIAPPAHCAVDLQQSDPDALRAGNVRPLQFCPPNVGIRCPRCDSHQTQRLSQFGSTPCKALYRCTSCLEPFDYFKPF